MNTKLSRFLGLAVLLMFSGAALADQVYKWVDKDGHVHYSSSPPPSATDAAAAKAVNIAAPPPDAYGAKSDQAAINALNTQNKQAQDAALKSQQDAQQKQALQKACQAEKDQLQQMQDAHRVTYTDASGQTQYASGDDRLKAIDDLQKRIDKDCAAAAGGG